MHKSSSFSTFLPTLGLFILIIHVVEPNVQKYCHASLGSVQINVHTLYHLILPPPFSSQLISFLCPLLSQLRKFLYMHSSFARLHLLSYFSQG